MASRRRCVIDTTRSYRRYDLSITQRNDEATHVRVTAYDLEASPYPEAILHVKLEGVKFPAAWDALDALQKALDVARSRVRE